MRFLLGTWMILYVFVIGVFANPQWPAFGSGQKIKWDGSKIYFPGPINQPDRDKYHIAQSPSGKLDRENSIRNEEQTCVLTADPPSPDSQCCGVEAASSNRIVGGDATQLEQYPWLAHIQYFNSGQNRHMQLCGGFLISGRYVLSAAHCFFGEILTIGTPVNVILGDYNTTNKGPDCMRTRSGTNVCTDGEIEVPIESYVVHPDHFHDKTVNVNDIALVRLAKTVEYTKFIRPICLPTIDVTSSPAPNLRLYSAGWGAIKQRLIFELGRKVWAGEYDHVKRHVDLPYRSLEKCRENFGSFISTGHLCAGGERGKDSCRGDSGGPLMFENGGIFEAVGIVSAGTGKQPCGSEGYPAIYTNVVNYLDWIRDNIKT